MNEEILLALSIAGIPASFSTTKEKSWKELLTIAIPPHNPLELQGSGVIADFRVSGPETGHFAVDLDNLCEPLFSVLVNKKGWFAGKRPNIQWFKVTKTYGDDPGCSLSILQSSFNSKDMEDGNVLFSGLYSDDFPRSARDLSFISWVKANSTNQRRAERFSIQLLFGDAKPNIGDIATGRVKNIIDCLYPIIGGNVGAPEDWRVHELKVAKNYPGLSTGSVQIMVAKYH